MNSDVLPPIPSDPTDFNTAHHPTDNSFPIIAIVVIGILATGFLLVSYYVFVIKCCLNWHRVDILRRFSTSRRRDNPLIPEFPTIENRGLDETSIRTIPIFRYKNSGGFNDRTLCECAVCLSEFEEEEKLRFIPNCNHMFHIDCIDVWLQNNANCPLCRTSISATPVHSISQSQQPLSPLFGNPTLYQHDENFTGNDEDYVIIDLPGRHSVSMDQSLLKPETQRSNNSSSSSQQPSRTTQQRIIVDKNKTKVDHHHISSKGDECIDHVRSKFDVQPMRRSFSMGSLDDQQLYLMVQEIVKQQRNQANEILISPASSEGCSNSKLRPSFFSFGSGRGSKSSVLPIQSNS
ncbi:unnamed protein product [Rhodiola kirilowii]